MSKLIFLQSSINSDSFNNFLANGGNWMSSFVNFITTYGLKILGAIFLYVIGNWLIKKLTALIGRLLLHKNFDSSLSKFLLSLVKAVLLVLLFLAIAGVIGVPIMGFSAILAGLAVGIGAALNGSLGNLAGGVMLMIFRPFNVGDIIEVQGQAGVVQELGIFNTIILTVENKTVILPNGALSTGVIVNYKTHGNLRVDIDMAIANDQDFDKARAIALAAVMKHNKVLNIPEPTIAINSVSDFMTKIVIRPYTTQENYWDVYFGVTELVKKAFDEHGIQGPTPTRIVYNK